MLMDEVPLMPEESELPDAVRAVRDMRRRKFAWHYVFGGADGAAAARAAGYSDVAEGAKVRAHGLLQREDVRAAIVALTSRYLFSLAPKAVLRLGAILDNPKHAKHVKAIELVLDRVGLHAKTEVEVNHTVTVNHTDEALEQLRTLKALGVPREKLIEAFGYSGLARYENMLASQARPVPALIEGQDE